MQNLLKSSLFLTVALLVPLSVLAQESDSAPAVGNSLSGVIFEDENRDALIQEGESPAMGVIVDLLDAEGNFITRVLTGENGIYNFVGLSAGIYFLRFEFSVGFGVRSRGIEIGGEDFVFIAIPVIRPDSQYSFTRLQLTNPANYKGKEVSPYTP